MSLVQMNNSSNDCSSNRYPPLNYTKTWLIIRIVILELFLLPEAEFKEFEPGLKYGWFPNSIQCFMIWAGVFETIGQRKYS